MPGRGGPVEHVAGGVQTRRAGIAAGTPRGYRAVQDDLFRRVRPQGPGLHRGPAPGPGKPVHHADDVCAAPRSEKPRRRIDADPSGWQRLRDDLHALAMEHGPAWLDLARRTDVCPTMGGRDFELWHPLLALASWIESHGARGLLGLLQEHALTTIERGRDESVPDADEILLRIVADAVRAGDWLTPHEILNKANEAEQAVFKLWLPRTVTARLKTYGIPRRGRSEAGGNFGT